MRHYKANLSVVNAQYGDLERRIIEMYAADPDALFMKLPSLFELLVWNLVRDGYLELIGSINGEDAHPYLATQLYRLTEAGREFVAAYTGGHDLDPTRPMPRPRDHPPYLVEPESRSSERLP